MKRRRQGAIPRSAELWAGRARIELTWRLERSLWLPGFGAHVVRTTFQEGTARSIVENVYALRRITSVVSQSRFDIADVNLQLVSVRIEEVDRCPFAAIVLPDLAGLSQSRADLGEVAVRDTECEVRVVWMRRRSHKIVTRQA